jgi:hypothetical protein
MGSAKSLVMLVEIHHLEPAELLGDLLDLLLLAGLLNLYARSVPMNVFGHFGVRRQEQGWWGMKIV